MFYHTFILSVLICVNNIKTDLWLTFSPFSCRLLLGDEVWGEFQVQGAPWSSPLPGSFRAALATRDSLVANKQQV